MAFLAVYERIKKKPISMRVVIAGLIAFALAGFFSAWRDEHILLRIARNELSQRARFIAQIDNVKIGQGSDTNNAQVLVHLTVNNIDSNPSFVDKFTLHMHSSSFDYHGKPTDLLKEYVLTPVDKTAKITLNPEDSIANNPPKVIQQGHRGEGWLRFTMDYPDLKSTFLQQPGMVFDIAFVDVAGKPYTASYTMPKIAEQSLNEPEIRQSPSPKSPRQ